MNLQTKRAMKELVELLESFGTNGEVGDTNYSIQFKLVNKYLKNEVDTIVEIVGDCVNCEGMVDRNSNYENVLDEDGEDNGVICTNCLQWNDEEELKEKGIFLD